MYNPFRMMKKELAKAAQAKSPFDGMRDRELVVGIVGVLQSVPADRVRALIRTKSQSASKRDRYEARELAIVLFAQEELAKLPESVSDDEGMAIMNETLREIFDATVRR